MPNPVAVVNAWAKAQSTVTAICGTRISYRLTGTYPAIRLADIGPVERAPGERASRVQVECWADDYDTSVALAAAVDAAVEDGTLRGTWASAPCSGGAVVFGPMAMPDPESTKFRQQLDLELWLYPTE